MNVCKEINSPLAKYDALPIFLGIAFIVFETVADQQQYNFQTQKKKKIASGEKEVAGFITNGLFKYCRHPNYTCEQGFWVNLYLFSVLTSG